MAWAIASLVLCRLLACFVLPVYDDALITLRYARNLAEGHGFVYQVGQHVLGTTSPLFGLICAIPFGMHLPMPETVRYFNIACDVATLALTWAALSQPCMRLARLLFVAFFIVSPELNRICVGGMEMNLYLLLSVLSIRLQERTRIASVGLAAGCYFLRPEALLLVVLLLAIGWKQEGWRRTVAPAALATGIIGLPLLAIHLYYGAPLSQSVLAKLRMARPPVTQVLRQLLASEPLLALLLPLTAWRLWRELPKSGFVPTLAWWMLLQLVAYGAARPFIWSWYVEPIAYVALLLAACAGGDLLQRRADARPVTADRWGAAVASVLPVVVWIGIALRQGPSPVTTNVFVPLATWCREHTNARNTIMAYDVGAVGYYSGSRIYDLAGLVWPPGTSLTGAEVARRYAPDYLYLNATRATARMMSEPWLASRYRPIRRFSLSGNPELELTVENASAEWLQDYIVFERIDSPESPR